MTGAGMKCFDSSHVIFRLFQNCWRRFQQDIASAMADKISLSITFLAQRSRFHFKYNSSNDSLSLSLVYVNINKTLHLLRNIVVHIL